MRVHAFSIIVISFDSPNAALVAPIFRIPPRNSGHVPGNSGYAYKLLARGAALVAHIFRIPVQEFCIPDTMSLLGIS